MSNRSSITQFLLLAFTDTRELQLLHFWLFLGIYLAALLGNGLIITTIACDQHLHTPMYFFLLNLSLLDLGSISTIVPKSMANSLWDTRAISYMGCAAQVFLFFFFISAEYCLLTVMSYDRYIAICKPLHYGSLLGSRTCVHMAAAAWATGFLNALLHMANTFSLPLCKGNALDQFFCEIPQILKLSCLDAYLTEVVFLVFSLLIGFGCFVFIVLSYVQIFRAVLRIPSEQGRHKAFSTCLPHLAVVSLFVSTGMFAHLKPPSISSPSMDLGVAVLYSLVPSAVNPLIYSMRNQELKESISKVTAQVVLNSASAEYCLLTVMSYATCKPLHYGSLLGSRTCVHMAAAAWGTGFLTALLHTANTFSLPLCKGNAPDQFFCEIPQILKLSCSDAYLREVWLVIFGASVFFICFVFIVLSYVQIFRAVLKIPSEQGQHKAFSMCLLHLAVVSLVLTTAIFNNLKPPSISSPSLDLLVSVLYSVVPPFVNPLIYSMRNKELKDSLWKLMTGAFLKQQTD
ncbi:olfactory receptor 14A16-like [Caloenas nicobarica]|uniref:olfactory receptor 14A16-like n=1 Tax=Caloenas nicobarica TaxID=187106 RepID=UPI0032B76789